MSDLPSHCLDCGKLIPAEERAEGLAELNRRYPNVRPEDCIILCDDCAQGVTELLYGKRA